MNKNKKLKISKDITTICTDGNPIPFGIKMKRDLTIKEACHCFRNILGFDINLSMEEFDDREMLNEYRQSITDILNAYVKGDADYNALCEETYCYDEDNIGISFANHLYLLEYLIKKDIV